MRVLLRHIVLFNRIAALAEKFLLMVCVCIFINGVCVCVYLSTDADAPTPSL